MCLAHFRIRGVCRVFLFFLISIGCYCFTVVYFASYFSILLVDQFVSDLAVYCLQSFMSLVLRDNPESIKCPDLRLFSDPDTGYFVTFAILLPILKIYLSTVNINLRLIRSFAFVKSRKVIMQSWFHFMHFLITLLGLKICSAHDQPFLKFCWYSSILRLLWDLFNLDFLRAYHVCYWQ